MTPRGFAGVVLFVLFVLVAKSAEAIDHTFAASAQGDYAFAPEDYRRPDTPPFDGATVEVAAKITADLSDHFSANVKLCYGCHGFEADMAYFDYRVRDELNIRVGRFSPSFGAYNVRHDPANHGMSDKPLPYDMGRMLRLRDWNLGVIPIPFPQNGLEIDGTHWFGEKAQLDYAIYGVTDFKGDYAGMDLDFVQSRSARLLLPRQQRHPHLRRPPGAHAQARRPERSHHRREWDGRIVRPEPAALVRDLRRGCVAAHRAHDVTRRVPRAVAAVRTAWTANIALRFARRRRRTAYFIKHGAYVELEQRRSPIAWTSSCGRTACCASATYLSTRRSTR